MNQQYADALIYWIKERESIRLRKERGEPKPWSVDEVFRRTYFTNVRREDDKVTRWIREFYSPYVHDSQFELNIIMSRFVNKPETLERIGYIREDDPDKFARVWAVMSEPGTWGNAYVITTHGIPMGKAQYLAVNVLGGAYRSLPALRNACRGPTLQGAHVALKGLEGLGDFLAAQVVADLKNTIGHELHKAEDWFTFVAPGPGSIRGASWVHYGAPGNVTATTFKDHFWIIYNFVHAETGMALCAQDIQNCLCEFDKYCRVRTGIGRSKRGYNG